MWVPQIIQVIRLFSIDMYWNNHGDLGVPHLQKPPYSIIFLNSCWTHHFFVRLIIYSLDLPRVVPCKIFRSLVPWNTWGNLFMIPAGFKNNPLSSNGGIFPSRIANLQHLLGLLTLPHFKTHQNESYLVGYILHISPSSFYPWWTLYEDLEKQCPGKTIWTYPQIIRNHPESTKVKIQSQSDCWYFPFYIPFFMPIVHAHLPMIFPDIGGLNFWRTQWSSWSALGCRSDIGHPGRNGTFTVWDIYWAIYGIFTGLFMGYLWNIYPIYP